MKWTPDISRREEYISVRLRVIVFELFTCYKEFFLYYRKSVQICKENVRGSLVAIRIFEFGNFYYNQSHIQWEITWERKGENRRASFNAPALVFISQCESRGIYHIGRGYLLLYSIHFKSSSYLFDSIFLGI